MKKKKDLLAGRNCMLPFPVGRGWRKDSAGG